MRSPPCPHLILSLSTHSLSRSAKLPCARDLTSWWVKVLACMELAFQEETENEQKGHRRQELQRKQNSRLWQEWAGGRQQQLGRSSPERGSQRDSWAEIWVRRGSQSCKSLGRSLPGGGWRRVHGLSSGEELGAEEEQRMLLAEPERFSHSHACLCQCLQ